MPKLDDDPVTGLNLVKDGLKPALPSKGPGAPAGVGGVVDSDMRVEGVLEILPPSFSPIVSAAWGHCAVTA